jgi:hypothetical protein
VVNKKNKNETKNDIRGEIINNKFEHLNQLDDHGEKYNNYENLNIFNFISKSEEFNVQSEEREYTQSELLIFIQDQNKIIKELELGNKKLREQLEYSYKYRLFKKKYLSLKRICQMKKERNKSESFNVKDKNNELIFSIQKNFLFNLLTFLDSILFVISLFSLVKIFQKKMFKKKSILFQS